MTGRFVAVVDEGGGPTAAGEVDRLVADAHHHRFLPFIIFRAEEATARRVARVSGVVAVIAVPADALDTAGVVDGIDVLLGVASAQRVGNPIMDLYGGTAAADPYPVLRPGTPPTIGEDEGLSLATAPAAMVAVNLSFGPTSTAYRTAREDPVNLATLALAQDQLVVVAAGNAGTGPQETMSAWAEVDWVLAVGATEDDAGRRLAPSSSRGVADRPGSGPDLVAYGASALDASMTGTSFAAPRVTFLALLVAAALLQLRRAWPGAAPSNEGVRLVGAGILDSGFTDLDREVVPAPALPILGPDPDAVARVADVVADAEARVDVRGTPDGVRRILVGSARAVPDRGPHEVGAGFVDQDGVLARLAALTGADAADLLATGPLGEAAKVELGRHRVFDPDQLALLAGVVQVTSPVWAFDYASQQLGRVP